MMQTCASPISAITSGRKSRVRGWLHNKRSQRQAAVPDRARRQRLRPGRGGEGGGARRGLGGRRQGGAGVVARADGQGAGGQARPRRLRDRRSSACASSRPCTTTRSRPRSTAPAFLMEHRHLWLRSQRQHAIAPRPPRGGEGHPRLPRRPGLHPRGHADLHPRRLRGDDDALRGAVLRRGHGLPDPERPALQRGHRRGPRQGLLLRPDLPRREVEDAAPPHRVLDGRARDRLRAPRRRDGAGRGAGLPRRRARPREAPHGAEGASSATSRSSRT